MSARDFTSAGPATDPARDTRAARRPVALDRALLAEICSGDAAFTAELLARFARSCRALLPAMHSDAQRGAMQALAAAAHRLRGGALTVGALAFAQALLRVECSGEAGQVAAATEALNAALLEFATLEQELPAGS